MSHRVKAHSQSLDGMTMITQVPESMMITKEGTIGEIDAKTETVIAATGIIEVENMIIIKRNLRDKKERWIQILISDCTISMIRCFTRM